ncbi:MAG: sporulation membrane protein YtaF [Clostridia bacterium]|nr:sporulation membrane protein YtaF [Clostridia bacterium]
MVLSISILAISLSLDALGVGIAYGLRKISIPLVSKLVICFLSILYSGAALIAGKYISQMLNSDVSKFIGVFILIFMGVWIILQSLFKKEPTKTFSSVHGDKEKTLLKIAIKSLGITVQVIKNPADGDIDKSGVIDVSESLLLGLALSIDAIGVGIGSALAGFNSMAIPLAVGLFQLVFLYAGTFVGGKFSSLERVNKKFIALLPGILLIALGILRIY